MKPHIRYYESFETDFYPNLNVQLPPKYRWIRKDFLSRILSALIYGAALILSALGCKVYFHLKIKGAKVLRKAASSGCFLYGNHTQPVGDVFLPALAAFPRRIYTVVSPANMSLPVIGRLLPYLGALPLTDDLRGMKAFYQAVAFRIKQKHPVVIYPEGHVWDYDTKIRPFSSSSFKLPVKLNVPVYSFTTTYHKRVLTKRPAVTLYVDGPFYPTGNTMAEQAESLKTAVLGAMTNRSKESNTEYISYIPKAKEPPADL